LFPGLSSQYKSESDKKPDKEFFHSIVEPSFADLKECHGNRCSVGCKQLSKLFEGRWCSVGHGAEFHAALAPLGPLIALL